MKKILALTKTKSIGILEEIAEKFNAEHYYLEDII